MIIVYYNHQIVSVVNVSPFILVDFLLKLKNLLLLCFPSILLTTLISERAGDRKI